MVKKSLNQPRNKSFNERKSKTLFYIILIVVCIALLFVIFYFLRGNNEPYFSPDETCVRSPEICDGLDNDCDGDVDGAVLGNYTCGVGACRRTNILCIDGVERQCIPGNPSPEICGDRIDNDCDGVTDEGCR